MLCLLQQPVLPELYWAWSLIPLSIITVLGYGLSANRLSVLTARVLLLIMMISAGFFWAAYQAQNRLADHLPPAWEGQDIAIVGVVSELPQFTARRARFHFKVENILTPTATVPAHLRLSWYRNSNHAVPHVAAGERWHLQVRLKRPHGSINPHVADYEAKMLEQNVRAIGYVRPSPDNRLLEAPTSRVEYFFERYREKIRSHFQHYLADSPYVGVLIALVVGDQRAILSEQWEVFIRTGTSHLMAISGTHITLLAGMVYWLTYRIWRRTRLVLWLPAHKFALLTGLVAAAAYAMLAGFAVPARRAFFMLTVIAIFYWKNRNTRMLTVLGWVLLLVVILDPWAVNAAGFWLSFAAIALICLAVSGRVGRMGVISGWVRIQWAITLGLLPVLLTLFQQVSLVSPVANAIAIPVIASVIVPLALLAVVPGLEFLLLVAHPILQGTMMILQWLQGSPLAIWELATPPLWTVVAATVGIIWLLLPGGLGLGIAAGFPARWLGIPIMLPLLLVTPEKPAEGELWLTVLDVGQGLSVVARTRHHVLLYDTGPKYVESDSGQYVIVPYLRGEGIRKLDKIVISHADSDHSGGTLSVLKHVETQAVQSSIAADHPIREKAANNFYCYAGETWQWDGVHFEMLHPSDQIPSSTKRRDTNDSSCVLKITTAHGSVLLPGDIGKKTETALLQRLESALASDVLIVPHHGSRTSSLPEFVRQINPKYAVFTVGYRSRFGHPHAEVVERYRKQGSCLYRSDYDGAILLQLADDQITATTWRKKHRRFWHDDWSDLTDKQLTKSSGC